MHLRSEKGIYARYFICTNEKLIERNTDSRLYGTVSIREQIGGFGKDEEAVYEYQNWNCVFCGKKCVEKASHIASKTLIVLKTVDIRNRYDKSTEKSYPEIRILDFDVYTSEKNDEE